MYRKEMAQALEFLERSAAVAVSVDPSQLVPRSSVVGSPLQWIVDVCEAAMREKSSKKGAKTHPSLRQSVLVMAGSQDEAMAMEVEGTEEGKENHEVIQRGTYIIIFFTYLLQGLSNSYYSFFPF